MVLGLHWTQLGGSHLVRRMWLQSDGVAVILRASSLTCVVLRLMLIDSCHLSGLSQNTHKWPGLPHSMPSGF